MFYNDNLRQDDVDINITNQNVNTNDNMNYNMMGGYNQMASPIMQSPIIEPGRERIINRTFVHEVPQE